MHFSVYVCVSMYTLEPLDYTTIQSRKKRRSVEEETNANCKHRRKWTFENHVIKCFIEPRKRIGKMEFCATLSPSTALVANELTCPIALSLFLFIRPFCLLCFVITPQKPIPMVVLFSQEQN